MSCTGMTWAKPVAERFWPKVDKRGPDECWPWLGCVNRGMTRFFYVHHAEHAHRVAWMLTYGDIPEKHSVRHKCFNKICCNPAHLYLKDMNLVVRGKFWRRVNRRGMNECWPWIGPIQKGRAKFFYAHHMQSINRVVWMLTYGDILENHEVWHTCSNKVCCNPGHLYLRKYHKEM